MEKCIAEAALEFCFCKTSLGTSYWLQTAQSAPGSYSFWLCLWLTEPMWSSNLTFGPLWLRILTYPIRFLQSSVDELSTVCKTLTDAAVKNDLCMKCQIELDTSNSSKFKTTAKKKSICKDLKHILRKVFKNTDTNEKWDKMKSSLVKDGGRSCARVAWETFNNITVKKITVDLCYLDFKRTSDMEKLFSLRKRFTDLGDLELISFLSLRQLKGREMK